MLILPLGLWVPTKLLLCFVYREYYLRINNKNDLSQDVYVIFNENVSTYMFVRLTNFCDHSENIDSLHDIILEECVFHIAHSPLLFGYEKTVGQIDYEILES